MNLPHDLIAQRENSAAFHLVLARKWKSLGQESNAGSPLVYSALEYRLAIERVFIEMIYSMKDPELTVEEAGRLRTINALMSEITKIAGGNGNLLRKALLFNQFLAARMRLRKPLSTPNFGTLRSCWADLSELCHKQISPEETWESAEWIRSGYELLVEVDGYLDEQLVACDFGAIKASSMPKEVQDARREFLAGQIDLRAVGVRLDLIEPALVRRK